MVAELGDFEAKFGDFEGEQSPLLGDFFVPNCERENERTSLQFGLQRQRTLLNANLENPAKSRCCNQQRRRDAGLERVTPPLCGARKRHGRPGPEPERARARIALAPERSAAASNAAQK